ncbi:MAG: hypothetical protein R3E01_29655 [Pirellulaceae bacterium]
MTLVSHRAHAANLTIAEQDEMFDLFARYYQPVDRGRFERDLSRKQWVIQLRHAETGKLCGFSTQVLVQAPALGGVTHALFSGDTIVDPEHWNETALVREWGRLAMELRDEVAPEPLYWYLISKGYRTYRFLPVFFREFYPRRDRETPGDVQEILDALGRQLFCSGYDAQRGIVVGNPQKERLRAGVADITDARRQNADIRFFAEANPGHAEGDELCCLARLDVENFTRAGIRLLDPKYRPGPVSSARC